MFYTNTYFIMLLVQLGILPTYFNDLNNLCIHEMSLHLKISLPKQLFSSEKLNKNIYEYKIS